jgi:uncharacterized protein YkwD
MILEQQRPMWTTFGTGESTTAVLSLFAPRKLRSFAPLLNKAGAALVAVLLAILAHGAIAADRPPAAKLSNDEHRELSRLVAEYRAAGSDAEKKKAAVDAVIAMSPAATAVLAPVIEKELRPKLRRYSTRFQQQAALAAKGRVRTIDTAEVLQLRQTVLGLQKRGEGFTKEAIVRDGDPALQRLEKMLVVDREEVLAHAEKLQADRKGLEELGALWEQCQAHLPAPAAEAGEEPPKAPDFAEYLRGEEQLAAALALPMDPRTRAILAANSRLAAKLDPEEARTILALNLTRNLLGLSALMIDLKLCDAGRDHSRDMETLKFFAHQSPVAGKTTPWDRAKRFGTTASAENIVMGYHDGKAANMAWFHSPGHHKNMLGNHVRVGVGRSGVYFTEMFGK